MSMMPHVRPLALSLALLGLGLPAMAQETAPEAPAADAAPAEDLSMGIEVPQGPPTKETAQVGQIYLGQTFDLWELRCEKTEAGADPCQLFQLLYDQDKNPVIEFSMTSLPPGGQAAAGATIIAPLETLLTANLTITIDQGKAKIYPFNFCTQIGCVARVGFTADEVEQFKKGAKATITVVPAGVPDEKVNAEVSLKGFTAGYQAVVDSMPKN